MIGQPEPKMIRCQKLERLYRVGNGRHSKVEAVSGCECRLSDIQFQWAYMVGGAAGYGTVRF